MASRTMRAVVVKKPGSATGLSIDTIAKPVPKDGELLVKVRSFALNRMDILQRDGQYPVPPGTPETLGVEFAGDVVEVGGGVTQFGVGDRVFGLVSGGAYAEYAIIPETTAMRVPDEFTYQYAAAIPEVWFTAYQALHFITHLSEGEDILIHAGASGVGTSAIQLAKLAKANKIIVTAGTDDKLKFCKSLGATHGVNYKTESFKDKVAEITNGKGVNVIVDFIGAGYWDDNLASLGLDGRMVMLAFLSGATVKETSLAPILRKRLKIEGTTLRSRTQDYQIQLRDAVVKDVVPHLVDGKLKAVVDREYAWTEIVEAHQHMESNKSIGKIIVNVA
ncbi:hypothetical protein HK104_005746 [Borealophlyctis nickersoniae]|nr:hypothetical protein HK104_005746 [Borealophlyctis nickersoniae]